MHAIVLTSNMRRHNFVANTAAVRLDVIGVWQEAKSFQPLRYATSSSDEAAIERHFAAREASEAEYFADHDRVRGRAVAVAPGGCNEADAIEAMRRAEPDVVLVFGTGLLKQPLIDTFPGRILNIHLGLSPFYRGAGTNFWPLVNREPEYCGATIHFLDAGVDTGPVIAHVRPDIRRGDGPHDIGNRTIVAAADMLVEAALALGAGGVASVPQSGGGRVYKRADFTADAVNRLYANFAGGMIDEYLRDRDARDRAVPLVQLVPTQPHERAVP
jgi:folate-dependent phosphoribosylglycinamide formyltransferase PurN